MARVTDCPVCGKQPTVTECGPWPKKLGTPPWSAGCYSVYPVEHFIGINADNEDGARAAWNDEAIRHAALIAQAQP